MAYKIICYGDSNTYGACGFAGGRHHADIRWTGILQNSGLSIQSSITPVFSRHIAY